MVQSEQTASPGFSSPVPRMTGDSAFPSGFASPRIMVMVTTALTSQSIGIPHRLMNVLLISTYELGRQPFGIASPAAWLKREGVDVRCLDLAIQRLDPEVIKAADIVCFYVPMHTATRIAL